jgi:hypothetical protein
MRRAERPQESVEQNEKPVGFESEPEEDRITGEAAVAWRTRTVIRGNPGKCAGQIAPEWLSAH